MNLQLQGRELQSREDKNSSQLFSNARLRNYSSFKNYADFHRPFASKKLPVVAFHQLKKVKSEVIHTGLKVKPLKVPLLPIQIKKRQNIEAVCTERGAESQIGCVAQGLVLQGFLLKPTNEMSKLYQSSQKQMRQLARNIRIRTKELINIKRLKGLLS